MGWLDTLSSSGGSDGGKSSWIGPVVGAGISAAGSIYGANKQASSNDKATAAQMAANAAALQFEQQKYGDLKARIAPWIASGQSSNQRMADLLHLAPVSGPTAPAGPTSGAPTGPSGPVDANGAPMPAGVIPHGSGAGSVSGMASRGASLGTVVPGVGTAVGAGVGALIGLAVRVGGNNTNRQRQAFAKSIIGTEDTNAFDDYLRKNLDPTVAEGLINTAHRVIGKNDTTANTAWMQSVQQALQHDGSSVAPWTLQHPQSGATKTLTDPALIAHYLERGAQQVSA